MQIDVDAFLEVPGSIPTYGAFPDTNNSTGILLNSSLRSLSETSIGLKLVYIHSSFPLVLYMAYLAETFLVGRK